MINRFTSVQHKLMYLPISLPRASAAAKRNQLPPMAGKKKSKARLITISPSDGRWHGKWNSDYTFSIQELQLHDLPDDVQKDTDVSVALSIQKDNIRLATSVEETCSESCNNSQPKLHHLGARNRASIERRWHKLLELKKNNL
ncbi:UNVERIFIED_CONTAM: Large ribosomal RNA subunit accumulation protein YCED2, chloroplastic [Sesamum calycinum]|uniref:Large ribosomal RNA subunit accumulation protein YCED2, chloroplastic n=1 Tax=Sesamum calycinum TaxID=2727403 RepID=A0AAW2QY68_9LAMI